MDNPDHLDSDELAKQAFKEMDYNKDNTISKDEFLSACMGCDMISTNLAWKMLDVCMIDCE